ncbi:MAG: glycosyltransferase family 39 protein [Nitrospiraceae bacterium]
MVQFRPVIFSTNRIIELRLPPWNFDEPRGRVSNRTSWFYPPVILFLTCLVLFLLGLDKIDEASDPAYEDTISYLKVATFLQDHGGLANFWTLFIKGEHKAVLQHPLYPLLLASFGVEPHELFAAGKMLSLIVGVAVVATCFLIARNLYGNLVAYLATLLLAFNVTFLRTVSHVMCESLLTLFVLLSVYWMITGVEKERHWPWAGAAAGFAYLTKGTGFLLLPVFTVTAILV